MDALYNYITDPNTIVSLIIFVFWLGVMYSKFLWKLKELDNRLKKIEDLDLDQILTKIQTNLEWIMNKLDKLDKIN